MPLAVFLFSVPQGLPKSAAYSMNGMFIPIIATMHFAWDLPLIFQTIN
jgi:hypothetical protein